MGFADAINQFGVALQNSNPGLAQVNLEREKMALLQKVSSNPNLTPQQKMDALSSLSPDMAYQRAQAQYQADPFGQNNTQASPGQPSSLSSFPGGQPSAAAPASPTAPPAQPSALAQYTPQPDAQKPNDGRDYGFLQSLPTQYQTIVQGLADGDEQAGSIARSSPMALALFGAAKRFDPTFSATTYTQRNSTAKDVASGQFSKDKVQLNSVAGHIYDLDAAAPLLKNGSSPAVNSLRNWVTKQVGGGANKGINQYETILERASPELNKFYVGGEGDKEGRASAKTAFSSDQDPTVIHNNVETQIGLLKSKAEALQAKADQGSGRPGKFQVLDPITQALFDDLNGKPLTAEQKQMVNKHRVESNLSPKAWAEDKKAAQITISREAALAELRARGKIK